MTTLKVDTITNAADDGRVNIEDGLTVFGGTALGSYNRFEHYESASTPETPANGATWWNSPDFKIYIEGEWYSFNYTTIT